MYRRQITVWTQVLYGLWQLLTGKIKNWKDNIYDSGCF
jgi:hypothetical protein